MSALFADDFEDVEIEVVVEPKPDTIWVIAIRSIAPNGRGVIDRYINHSNSHHGSSVDRAPTIRAFRSHQAALEREKAHQSAMDRQYGGRIWDYLVEPIGAWDLSPDDPRLVFEADHDKPWNPASRVWP